MIGLQDLIIKQNIKVSNLAKEVETNPSNIWRWFKDDHIPKKYLKKLSEILNVKEDYLNEKVNNINTYKPRNRQLNEYEIRGDTTVIFMPMKTGEILETLIDTEDLEKVRKTNLIWHGVWDIYSESYYAKATAYKQKPSTVSLHRIIMGVTEKHIKVDHENYDTLDNRKYNLRVTIQDKNLKHRNGKNSNNTSGYRNVFWNKKDERWIVQLQVKSKNKILGRFKFNELEKAGEFAEEMRLKYYGEFAGRN